MCVKKVYISMPMSCKSRGDIEQVQNDVLAAVGEHLQEEVSLADGCLDEDDSPLVCLGESLKRMASADYAVFVQGWAEERGCIVERICADRYGIPYFEVEVRTDVRK